MWRTSAASHDARPGGEQILVPHSVAVLVEHPGHARRRDGPLPLKRLELGGAVPS
jgi:hypothetical protein